MEVLLHRNSSTVPEKILSITLTRKEESEGELKFKILKVTPSDNAVSHEVVFHEDVLPEGLITLGLTPRSLILDVGELLVLHSPGDDFHITVQSE